MLTRKDYQNALDVQSACNLSGVVKSFADVMGRIFDEGHSGKKGTDWINTHSICRLYAEQIAHLSGAGMASDCESYQIAYRNVELNSLKDIDTV